MEENNIVMISILPYWLEVDDLHYVRKLSDNKFEVVEVTKNNKGYAVYQMNVNMNDYDLEHEIKGYFDSLDEVKEDYGEEWQYGVAEAIADKHTSIDEVFEGHNEMKMYLNDKYDIIVE